MANQVVWLDIPASDLDRAIRFHAVALDSEGNRIARHSMWHG